MNTTKALRTALATAALAATAVLGVQAVAHTGGTAARTTHTVQAAAPAATPSPADNNPWD
ncbi:hypothetical protein [Streptantibioticus silvisoli]|jgi:hypothetical protein|uniref:Uncharacterized protein n=1 Tax=Streptantibioticus silvisoli TaxID=2705255 RepID=A0ABT6W052_9ACTN|nr:hypothetical protein [Streptantibioticus silvisoli]MDI5963347.1 hypothetical protein [Streptantibioticus silvisoli]